MSLSGTAMDFDGGYKGEDPKHACGDAAGFSGGAGGAGGEEDVLTAPQQKARPASRRRGGKGTGRQPGALRRGTEKNRVRGYETRRRLIELHVYQHMGLGECAQALDLSYGRTLAQWHRIVAEVQDGEVPEEQLHDVRTHCDQMLRHMITTSLPLVAKSAAYGMLVLKALDGLCRLHGVARPEAVAGGPGPATLAEIGARVRVVSPLMIDKLDRVRALGSQVDGFVERLLDLKVSLYWHSQRVETMLEGGKRNPAAGMMLAVLAEMALAERETLRERILSGLENARRRGRKLGRPVGTVMTPGQLLERHSGIVRLLRAGKSLRDVAARSGKGLTTVKRIRAAMLAAKGAAGTIEDVALVG